MTVRRLVFLAALLLGVAALFFLLRPAPGPAIRPPASASSAASPAAAGSPSPSSLSAAPAGTDSLMAAALNAPDGTIRRDLELLNEVFFAFHTNFPSLGNPVGENAEITAALTGKNPAQFAFISPHHRAINTRGELCDRWGTPFRFHQVSGTQMEIRSAGPDRKFGTADDTQFSP